MWFNQRETSNQQPYGLDTAPMHLHSSCQFLFEEHPKYIWCTEKSHGSWIRQKFNADASATLLLPTNALYLEWSCSKSCWLSLVFCNFNKSLANTYETIEERLRGRGSWRRMALHATGNWKTRWVSPPRLRWKAVRARCDCGDLRCCKNTSALDSFDIWKKFVAERKAQSTSIQNGQNPLDTSDQTETETKKSSANKKAVESHGIGSPWRVPIRGRPFSFNISFQLMWSFKKTALQPVLNHERWWPIQIPLNGQHFWNAQCLEKNLRP